jgi:hypothetical protein
VNASGVQFVKTIPIMEIHGRLSLMIKPADVPIVGVKMVCRDGRIAVAGCVSHQLSGTVMTPSSKNASSVWEATKATTVKT